MRYTRKRTAIFFKHIINYARVSSRRIFLFLFSAIDIFSDFYRCVFATFILILYTKVIYTGTFDSAIGKIKEVTYIARCDLHTKRNDSRYSMDRDLGSQRGEQAEFMPESARSAFRRIYRPRFYFPPL